MRKSLGQEVLLNQTLKHLQWPLESNTRNNSTLIFIDLRICGTASFAAVNLDQREEKSQSEQEIEDL